MPAFGGAAAGHEIEVKKRSTEEIASGITSALLILVVVFFTCGSLWLGIFAIPSFFAFFRASVVAISSIREVRMCLYLFVLMAKVTNLCLSHPATGVIVLPKFGSPAVPRFGRLIRDEG